jgi:hypothetical protein
MKILGEDDGITTIPGRVCGALSGLCFLGEILNEV